MIKGISVQKYVSLFMFCHIVLHMLLGFNMDFGHFILGALICYAFIQL